MIWYRLPEASSLDLPVMAEHYQKRIHSSRYFGWCHPKHSVLIVTVIASPEESQMFMVVGRRVHPEPVEGLT